MKPFALFVSLLLSCSLIADAPHCLQTIIEDDSHYVDTLPERDISWTVAGGSVQDIANAFNYARAKDPTISKPLIMPMQKDWDAMDIQQRALYLLNAERYDRGIKPFEGIDDNVVKVANDYAKVLHTTGTFSHNEDSSPWKRLDNIPVIYENRNFFRYAENLYNFGSSVDHILTPMARAVYTWIYADAKSKWGHRKFCLAPGLIDDSGLKGAEGLVGFALIQSEDYGLYPGRKSTLVVMNAFDPAYTWDHAHTRRVYYCSHIEVPELIKSPRFTVDVEGGTVSDRETGLMWQNAEIAHHTRMYGTNYCENMNFAGYSDWRMPQAVESRTFHRELHHNGFVPNQAFWYCTAEVTSDGYVRTKRGSQLYGKRPGDIIRFKGKANIRCVREMK
ncbi:MAG: DUF1566 domain-containing protein [Sulfurimonadaceae bacterium]|nr:DUF1566 domain-containing protein [Sulfurimonadaceae bacterium]